MVACTQKLSELYTMIKKLIFTLLCLNHTIMAAWITTHLRLSSTNFNDFDPIIEKKKKM